MLINCQECKREISDQAQSCPHCGHPVRPIETLTSVVSPAPKTEKPRAAPIFLILGFLALLVGLDTPRILIFFPVMAAVGFSIIALFRREKAPALSVLVLLGGVGLWMLSGVVSVAPTTLNLDAAEITSMNWRKDPSFGTRGTIKWNVEVRNKSAQNIGTAKVEFSTYDSGGNLVSSTFTYVRAIPAGQSRADNSYADLYGTEQRAQARITEVRFAR